MSLTTKHLHIVLTALKPAAKKWKLIGMELGLEEDELPDPQLTSFDSLRETLSEVFHRGAREWTDFTKALRSQNVSREDVAMEIEKRNLQPHSSKETDLEPPPRKQLKLHVDTQARKSTNSSGLSFDVEAHVAEHLKTITLEKLCYEMEASGKHGKALIININKDREGSIVDRDNLKDTLEGIRYDVEIKEDLNGFKEDKEDGGEFGDAVYECANGDKNCDSFICCILAHGSEGRVKGADGKQVKIADIARRLVDIEHLKEKPKIFFFQACQGSKAPLPQDKTDEASASTSRDVLDVALPTTFPRHSDFFYGCATSFETVSIRNTAKGSVYIRALCGVMKSKYTDEDLVTMVTRVHKIVSEKPSEVKGAPYMQQPQIVTTLRKRVFFK